MNYAFIENGVITNIIALNTENAHEFPDVVNVDEYPVGVGDTFVDGVFYRNGIAIPSYDEMAAAAAQRQLLSEMDEAYREGVNSV